MTLAPCTAPSHVRTTAFYVVDQHYGDYTLAFLSVVPSLIYISMLHRCRLCLAVIPRSSVQTSRTFVESASQRASSVPPRSRYIYDSHSQQWIKRPPHRPSVSREERQERAAEAASIEATGDSQLGRPVQPTGREIRSALKDDKPRYVRGQDSSTLKVSFSAMSPKRKLRHACRSD